MSAEENTNGRRLPPGWRMVRLGEVVATAVPGFACGQRDPNGVVQLRMNNVDRRGNLSLEDHIRVPADGQTILQFQLSPGDVLFNNTNSVELVGKSAIFSGYVEPVVHSNHFTRLRANRERLDPTYLSFWLQRQWQLKVFENLCNRWIGQAAVKSDKLLALEIPLPPLEEQKRIAAIMNEQTAAVKRARAATEAQLKASKALPAAYLRAVFNSPEAQQWPKKQIGGICRDISDGTHFTPTYVSEGVPFLSVKDVKETGLSFSDCRFISKEQHQEFCRRCKPERGDVLYTKVGTTGIAKAVDTDRDFSIFVSVALLKLVPGVNPFYLEKVLNAPICRIQAADLTQGMANRNLVLQDLKRIEVPIPPPEQQDRLASMLAEQMGLLAQMRKAVEDQLETVNKLPAAILRRAFNGEL